MKALTEISDRLVAWLVPRTAAHADECGYAYKCEPRTCNSSPLGSNNRMRRLVCASGRVTYWENYGCCEYS